MKIVMNSRIADELDVVSAKTGASVKHAASAKELLAHELIGHALGMAIGSRNANDVNAIQVTNLCLRVSGQGNVYRTGDNHNNIDKPLPKGIATQIPGFLKNNKN